jgi:nucleoside-diphosphate-sugar epimerase
MTQGRQVSTVAITGATGYLGGLLSSWITKTNRQVIELTRGPTRPDQREFHLGVEPGAHLLDEVDLLIHCAYDMTVRDARTIWRVNVDGTRRLLDLAVARCIPRIVVLSSMSAYPGTSQLYGRAKLQIESDSQNAGAVIIRPGLVYGPQAGGMVGTLRMLARFPVIPLIAGHAVQFTVHEDDLVRATWALAVGRKTPNGPVGIANPVPVPFRDVLERLALEQGCHPRFVPVSWRLVHAALVLAERAGLALPLRSDSLLGLVHPANEVPNEKALSELGIRLRRYGEPGWSQHAN